jgi:hypothetical protein
MNKLLSSIAIKYGIILIAINMVVLIFSLVSLYSSINTNGYYDMAPFITSSISTIALILILPMAHYEFNKKNGHYMSFNDAIVLGMLILGSFFLFNVVFNTISFELFLKKTLLANAEFEYQIRQLQDLNIGYIIFVFRTPMACCHFIWNYYRRSKLENI